MCVCVCVFVKDAKFFHDFFLFSKKNFQPSFTKRLVKKISFSNKIYGKCNTKT